MSRYLVYTSPARGHLYPIVETLLELQERGHEIHVRTLASEVDRMGSLGFEAAPIEAAIEDRDLDDWAARTPIGAQRKAVGTFIERARLDAPDLGRAIDETQPDALYIDINTWGAACTAEASGLPWALFTPYSVPLASKDAPPFGLGLTPRRDTIGKIRNRVVRRLVLAPLERMVVGQINNLRASIGVRPVHSATDFFAGVAPVLVYYSAEPFEYPRSDWPSSVRLVGPGTWDPPTASPEWLERIEKPLVLITCSTEFQDDGKLIEVALEGLADEDVTLVATSGGVDTSGMKVPPGTIIEPFLPHGPPSRAGRVRRVSRRHGYYSESARCGCARCRCAVRTGSIRGRPARGRRASRNSPPGLSPESIPLAKSRTGRNGDANRRRENRCSFLGGGRSFEGRRRTRGPSPPEHDTSNEWTDKCEAAGLLRENHRVSWGHDSPGAVLKTECDAVLGIASQLTGKEFSTPTACEPWDVKALLAHMWRDLFRIPKALEDAEPSAADVDAIDYWTSYDPQRDAPGIAAHAMETAAAYDTGAQVVAAFQEIVVECFSLISKVGPERRIQLWWGPRMRLDEFLKTRVLEIVVHGIDLTDALHQRSVATPDGILVTETILNGLLGESRPSELAWSDLDFIHKGTGREPLTDMETVVLGPLSDRFPLLG